MWDVKSYVNRDSFKEWTSDMVIPFFGWYGYDSFSRPPESQTVLMSLHFSIATRKKILGSKRFLDWFRDTAKAQAFPVYARDISTRDWLRNLGIDSEFGGCVTSTLPKYEGQRKGVLAVEAPPGSCTPDQSFSNAISYLPTLSAERRLEVARGVLDQIATAEIVHTNRLHIALPCRALGTPFVFYDHNIFERHRLSGHGLIDGV
jgi:hypothetical protein